MNRIHSESDLVEQLETHELILLFLGMAECGVCQASRQKIEALLEEYPAISGFYCPADQLQEIAGQHLVFAVPTVLLFRNQQEAFRTARFIDFQQLRKRLFEWTEKTPRE